MIIYIICIFNFIIWPYNNNQFKRYNLTITITTCKANRTQSTSSKTTYRQSISANTSKQSNTNSLSIMNHNNNNNKKCKLNSNSLQYWNPIKTATWSSCTRTHSWPTASLMGWLTSVWRRCMRGWRPRRIASTFFPLWLKSTFRNL